MRPCGNHQQLSRKTLGSRLQFIPLLLTTLFTVVSLHATDYEGSVGKMAAHFSIVWNDDGTVDGSYYYPARPNTVYTLRGQNLVEGELHLDEYTDGQMTARCSLTKSLQGGLILWSGTVENLNGPSFAMSFQRDPSPAAEPTWDKIHREKVIVAMNSLPEEIVWREFPDARVPIDMVPLYMEGTGMRTRIEAYSAKPGWTEIRVICGIHQPGNVDEVHFTGRTITWKVARDLPVPAEKMIGEELTFIVSPDGILQEVYFPALVITHWRKTAGGLIEIRGTHDLQSDPVMKQLKSQEMTGAEATRLLASAPNFSLIPDKLAIDEIPTGEFVFRDMRVMQRFGLVIQMTGAGPGMIELESLSLDDPVGEAPWIFLGTEVPGDLVPLTQRTREAG